MTCAIQNFLRPFASRWQVYIALSIGFHLLGVGLAALQKSPLKMTYATVNGNIRKDNVTIGALNCSSEGEVRSRDV